MRELKFRAWDKIQNKMYYDVQNPKSLIYTEISALDFYKIMMNERFVLMQCTEALDSEGNLIWEGDVINAAEHYFTRPSCSPMDSDYVPDASIENYYETTFLVKYDSKNCCFTAIGEGFCESTDGFSEVLGNVYEKPELLKEIDNERP